MERERINWDLEGCIVSDKITKEGYKVGYMVREEPAEGKPDSGWRFMAGNEDDGSKPIFIGKQNR